MSPHKFESRMEWLKNAGYPIISLNQAINSLTTSNLSPYSTVITIDDGWYGSYLHMLPIIEKHKFPATLYVYTGAVDSQKALQNILLPALIHLSKMEKIYFHFQDNNRQSPHDLGCTFKRQEITEKVLTILETLNETEVEDFCRDITSQLGFDFDKIIQTRQFSFMNYEEISDANNRGLDIQLHTDSHRLNIKYPEKITQEIKLNREKLRPHVSSSLNHFCYPSGIHSSKMYSLLQKSKIKSATLIDTGLVTNKSNKYALKRILDGQDISLLEFEAEMSGFLEILRKIRRLSSSKKLF